MNKKNHVKSKKYFDYTLLFIVFFLLGFGLVMIYSTSSYSASLAYDGDGLFYLRKQLISTSIGLAVMVALTFVPYRIYTILSPFAYAFSILTLFLILTPLGYTANGATRWIRVFGFSIQPAEIVKIGVILITALIISYYSKASDKDRNSLKFIIITLLPAGLAALLIFVITNNFSSAVIVLGIAYAMLLISSPKCYKAWIILLFAVCLAVFAVIAIVNGFGTSIWGFRGERILAWLNPEAYADGKGFQTLQALYGIGSGGIKGKGLGKSMQKLGFLPESYNDMIFSVICEELGLVGGIAVIFLFILLLFRIRDIAFYTKNYFGNLLVTGVFSHIAIQVVLNICVVTNTLPNTGISLPFISYGGSSVIFLLAEIGIVMNVCRNADFRKDDLEESEESDG